MEGRASRASYFEVWPGGGARLSTVSPLPFAVYARPLQMAIIIVSNGIRPRFCPQVSMRESQP